MSRTIVTEAGFYGGKFLNAGASYDADDAEAEIVAEQTLDEMSRAELVIEAERLELVVKSGDTKGDIIAAIRAKA